MQDGCSAINGLDCALHWFIIGSSGIQKRYFGGQEQRKREGASPVLGLRGSTDTHPTSNQFIPKGSTFRHNPIKGIRNSDPGSPGEGNTRKKRVVASDLIQRCHIKTRATPHFVSDAPSFLFTTHHRADHRISTNFTNSFLKNTTRRYGASEKKLSFAMDQAIT